MPKQILNEQSVVNRSVSLIESVKTNPGCLGTIYGVCADFKEKTRNGNFYSRKLWENVFKDPLVKESLEDRILFGELGHPQDRLETDITKACIVMTDYEFDDTEGVVRGHFDILNTPAGKIFKSLLDYGCVCGLSSRGEGDVIEESGQNNIDENSYYFVGFDVVALPAVKKAKPSLQESVNRVALRESIRTQVANISNKEVLDTVKSVIESTKMPELDSIIESINIKSKELEGSTDSSNLIEDLENLTRQLDEVKQENVKLKESVVTYKGRLSHAITSCNKAKSKFNEHEDECKRLNESLKLSQKEVSDYKSRLKISNQKRLEQVSLSHSQKDEYALQISKLNESLSKKSEEFDELRKNCQELSSKLKEVTEKYNTSKAKFSESKQSTKQITESRNILSENLKTMSQKVDSLSDEVNSLNQKLEESRQDLSKKDKSYQDLLKSYVNLKSQMTGVSPEIIFDSIKKDSTSQVVDSIVESIVDRSDRYRSLSTISDSDLFESSAKLVKKESEEDSQFKSFMNQMMKLN